MFIFQLSSPPLCSSLDLFSVSPKSTPLLHFLYSQLVCLLPVGFFKHYVYHTVIPVCLFGPEKPRQGRGQLSTCNCCHHFILDKIRVSCEVFIVHVGSHKILGKHRKPLNTLLFWRKTIRVRKYITLLFLLIAAVIHEHGLFCVLPFY